jgi:putative SOS response-associated peptidase YedK
MCGRYTLAVEAAEVMEDFDLMGTPLGWKPRYNVAPTQAVAVITALSPAKLDFMKWGLVPSWAKDIEIGNRLINARSETISEKPAFRGAFKYRRCLILADGFYEWQRIEGKRTTPYYIQRADHKLFAFAGIWEHWQSKMGDELLSCSIITCAPNELMAPIHDRMPVILDKDSYASWIEQKPGANPKDLLVPYPAEKMSAFPVSRIVNDPKNDVPQCILPASEGT